MKRLFSVLFLLSFLFSVAYSQISGIINLYDKVVAVNVSANMVTVTNAAIFHPGDTVLIIQMKGASVNQSNGASYGNISNLNEAGNFELAEICTINGNDIYLKHTLLKTYDPSGAVQLVYVPQFTDTEIVGTLTAPAWDGDTGGVLVFEASGTVVFNADIDLSEKGFRGGSVNPNGGDCFSSNTGAYFYSSSSVQAGGKGEGIAVAPAGHESGMGKFANGGGGGNSHNTGGGGGGNFGDGGRGGNRSGSCAAISPNPFGIGGLGFGLASYIPGDYKIFAGGGGGAGQQNNARGNPGGNGGGIVIIRADVMEGNNFSVKVAGQSVPMFPFDNGDGNGGGGAGGTVLLEVENYSSPVNIDASGGSGGSTDNTGSTSNRDFGPGGGGGGGVLWCSSPFGGNALLNGGLSGISAYCSCSHGAAAGSAGGTLTGLALPRSTTLFPSCSPLPVELLSFTAKLIHGRVKLEWETGGEKNNGLFTLEKSRDLSDFFLAGQVKGAGSSSAPIRYLYYDSDPFAGISYYRLSQTDLDGNSKVIGLVAIRHFPGLPLVQRVYPMPFQNEVRLELNQTGPSSERIYIRIYNALGELVYASEREMTSEIVISAPGLSAGIYNVMVQSEYQQDIMKIFKER